MSRYSSIGCMFKKGEPVKVTKASAEKRGVKIGGRTGEEEGDLLMSNDS